MPISETAWVGFPGSGCQWSAPDRRTRRKQSFRDGVLANRLMRADAESTLMKATIPHYLLYSESSDGPGVARWRFVLRSADGADRLEADEIETEMRGERLELLAVVRGLEALDQPSRVTLVTTSKYVREGIRHGVVEWRRNGWCWECFGQMVPVKHQDLWKRVDRALAFHNVECRTLRVDPPHKVEAPVSAVRPCSAPLPPQPSVSSQPTITRTWASPRSPVGPAPVWRQWKQKLQAAWMALAPSM